MCVQAWYKPLIGKTALIVHKVTFAAETRVGKVRCRETEKHPVITTNKQHVKGKQVNKCFCLHQIQHQMNTKNGEGEHLAINGKARHSHAPQAGEKSERGVTYTSGPVSPSN